MIMMVIPNLVVGFQTLAEIGALLLGFISLVVAVGEDREESWNSSLTVLAGIGIAFIPKAIGWLLSMNIHFMV